MWYVNQARGVHVQLRRIYLVNHMIQAKDIVQEENQQNQEPSWKKKCYRDIDIDVALRNLTVNIASQGQQQDGNGHDNDGII